MPEGPPRIKVCGVTRPDDALAAVAAGAWAVGMVFVPGSPRRCSREQAARVGAALRRRAEVAGVFANATLDGIARTAEEAGLTLVQLHGDEGPAFCEEVRRRTGCRTIKAVQARSGADVRRLRAFHTDFHLLDGWDPRRRGGTGATVTPELAALHSGQVPLILSGGLRPENVAEAIAAVRPWGVDASSGLESRPGVKDRERVAAFAAAVAATARGPAPASAGGPAPASA